MEMKTRKTALQQNMLHQTSSFIQFQASFLTKTTPWPYMSPKTCFAITDKNSICVGRSSWRWDRDLQTSVSYAHQQVTAWPLVHVGNGYNEF